MKKFRWLTSIFCLLLLCACSEDSLNNEANPPIKPQDEEEKIERDVSKEESEEQTVDLANYFMDDQAVAKYKGEGNEYASYTARTQWHNRNTVSIYEDNGGTIVLRTYRISEDSIDMIQEQGEFYDTFEPSDKELEEMPIISTFLKLPLKKGTSFDGWVIASVNESLTTPLKTFNAVIKLEKTDDSGAIQRKYITKQFGEVKREYIMQDGENEFIVTSTIESFE